MNKDEDSDDVKGFMQSENDFPSQEEFILRIPDRYQYLSTLGQGGMGVVYRVYDRQTNREIALKMILIEDRIRQTRFQREAESMMCLKHPNILEIYGYGEHPMHYTMPLLKETLEDRLAHAMKITEVVSCVLEIAEGLRFIHNRDFVHRDIKPGNIFFDGEIPKLADFGLVLHAEDTRLTQSGAVCGTLHYMSPEQIIAEPIDQRSDLFSLGVLFYRMLTGKDLFADDVAFHVKSNIINCDEYIEKRPWNFLRELQVICKRLIRRDKKERYSSASELIKDLREVSFNPQRIKSSSLTFRQDTTKISLQKKPLFRKNTNNQNELKLKLELKEKKQILEQEIQDIEKKFTTLEQQMQQNRGQFLENLQHELEQEISCSLPENKDWVKNLICMLREEEKLLESAIAGLDKKHREQINDIKRYNFDCVYPLFDKIESQQKITDEKLQDMNTFLEFSHEWLEEGKKMKEIIKESIDKL